MKQLKDLKGPQKQKYRIFAWKNQEKPFEAWETDDLEEAIKKAGDYFEDKRDFNFNVRPENEPKKSN